MFWKTTPDKENAPEKRNVFVIAANMRTYLLAWWQLDVRGFAEGTASVLACEHGCLFEPGEGARGLGDFTIEGSFCSIFLLLL